MGIFWTNTIQRLVFSKYLWDGYSKAGIPHIKVMFPVTTCLISKGVPVMVLIGRFIWEEVLQVPIHRYTAAF